MSGNGLVFSVILLLLKPVIADEDGARSKYASHPPQRPLPMPRDADLTRGPAYFVEPLSGMVMVWRFWKFDLAADDEEFEKIEHRAARLVGYSFFVLGGYVVLDAGYALYQQKAPQTSLIGIGLAIASIILMPVLFLLKYRLGKAIGSRSLVADSKETLACLMLSVALLIGLGAFYIERFW